VNSRIQGSAANQTKQAMRLINENKRLKELGFRILLLIHDEIVGECPIENAKEARDLFVGCMLESGKELKSKVAVDCECSYRWYGKTIDIDNLSPDEIKDLIAEENKKYR
jgi:DNA polymerase-1